jgi:glycosyltransferase involved in cell wall biosynthesis
MKVSVIIPTYNRADTLGRAVESVLAQTVRPEEVIVVNDGSTDDTAALLDRFHGQIRVLIQSNQGASAARNAGIRAASGDLIAFLDSDDYWQPTKNERQLELFQRYADQGVTCCICNARLEYADGTVLNSFDVTGLRPAAESGLWSNPAAVLVTRFLLFNQVVAVKRETLAQAGLFDESLRIMEDYDLQLRLAMTGPWAYLREPLVTWHGGAANSLTSSATEHQARRHAYAILQNFRQKDDLRRRIPPGILARRLWQLHHRIAAEEMTHRPEWPARIKGQAILTALRLWQALYSRLPGYPQMITSPALKSGPRHLATKPASTSLPPRKPSSAASEQP